MGLAFSLKKEAKISILGLETSLALSELADDCVGCLLVFDTEEAASKYVGIGGRIVEVALI